MIRRTLAALATGATATLAFAAPALATGTTTICPDWTLHSITGDTWEKAAEGSTVVDDHTVILTKPQGGGTEFATSDAGIALNDAGTITVAYVLSDGAKTDAGAIRLFYYDKAGANTLTEAPTKFVVADKESGTLTIEGVTKVGTLGLVYDASNDAGGKVTFSDLKVGDKVLSFTDKPCEASPSPSVSASTPAGGGAVPTTTAPAAGGTGAGLPVTGASTVTTVGIAAGLLAVGALLFFVFRRRRVRFTAEG